MKVLNQIISLGKCGGDLGFKRLLWTGCCLGENSWRRGKTRSKKKKRLYRGHEARNGHLTGSDGATLAKVKKQSAGLRKTGGESESTKERIRKEEQQGKTLNLQ